MGTRAGPLEEAIGDFAGKSLSLASSHHHRNPLAGGGPVRAVVRGRFPEEPEMEQEPPVALER